MKMQENNGIIFVNILQLVFWLKRWEAVEDFAKSKLKNKGGKRMREKKMMEKFLPAVMLFLMVLLAGTVVFAAELAGDMMTSYAPTETSEYKMTIKKVVKGLDGAERNRTFAFQMTYLEDGEGTPETLSVKGGESYTKSFEGSMKVNIREDVSDAEIKGYDFVGVSYHVKKTMTGATSNNGWEKIYIAGSEDTLTVTRKKTASDSDADVASDSDADGCHLIMYSAGRGEEKYYLEPGETKVFKLEAGDYALYSSDTDSAEYAIKLVREYDVKDENGVDITIEENADIQITATNTYIKKGGLMVEKVWKGDNEEERPDEIKVQLFQNGSAFGDPVTLKKGNWSYTWKNLPATDSDGEYYQYRVEETVVSGYEVEYSTNNQEGVFLATASDASRNTASSSDADEDEPEGTVPESAIITITNTKPHKSEPPEKGKLTIKKIVSGGPENAVPKKYFFKVEGPSYKDKAAEVMIEVGNEKEAEITLPDLEPGEYTVTEINKESIQEEGYTLSVTGEGTVTVNASSGNEPGALITITNTYNAPKTGSLFIKKTVGGSGDKEKEFHFMVSLKDENGNALPGSYSYSGSKEGTITDGATIVLRHDQSVTIVGLPENARYKVVEQEANADGYVTTLESGTGSDEGVIAAGETRSVHFHNTKDEGNSTPPPTPTTPPTTPSSTTPPRRGSRDPRPSNPNLPDVNDPDSPEQVTIVEDGVPTTYVKTWDPETEEYFYVPEDEVPLAPLPRTGDPSHTGMLVVLMVVSLMGIAAFSVLRFRRKR